MFLKKVWSEMKVDKSQTGGVVLGKISPFVSDFLKRTSSAMDLVLRRWTWHSGEKSNKCSFSKENFNWWNVIFTMKMDMDIGLDNAVQESLEYSSSQKCKTSPQAKRHKPSLL